MTVNGLQLPASFVKFFEEYRYSDWDPKEGVDAYGNPLEAEFSPEDSVEWMERMTETLARSFGVADHWSPELLQSQIEKERSSPGFIPYIEDFSKIVQFGRKLSGAPFYFDFRDSLQEPCVIYWEESGGYWRRVAPNFDSFVSHFKLDEEDDEEAE